MAIDTKKIQELRERTGAGLMKCKGALEQTDGDIEKAILELRKQGALSAAKKASRETKEGLVASYLHSNGRIGVLVTLYCETDFVAKNEAFQELAKDIAMQVAATDPKYLSREDIPAGVIEEEKKIEMEALKDSGKPENVVKQIIEGKINKFAEENTLLAQKFIKNPELTINDLLKEKIVKLGENIKIGKFTRMEL